MTTSVQTNAAPGHYAIVNGLKMYYEIHGTGKPLALLHGGGSTIETTFGKVLPLLAQKHQVIAIELQAHGRTADRDQPLSFEQDADDVAALLQYLNVGPADVFGFSNGGSTALQLAIRHPDLIHKLVVASAMYKRDGMFPGFWEFMNQGTIENMPTVLKDAYLSVTNDPAGLLTMHDKCARRMIGFQSWNELAIQSITAPTLVIAGDQDVVRPEHAVEMFRLLPQGRLAIFPGGHGSFMGELSSGAGDSDLYISTVSFIEEFLGN